MLLQIPHIAPVHPPPHRGFLLCICPLTQPARGVGWGARAFAEDMRAYFKETNGIKRDEIAARQAWLLERYVKGKLRTNDVKELFEAMKKDQA
jgi:hypothetical protein